MSIPLTPGGVKAIYDSNTDLKPTVQLVDIKKIITSNNGERFRLVLSDGANYIQGMLATQIADMVTSGQLKKYAFVKLTEYVCNTINSRRICIIIKCNVVAHGNAQVGSSLSNIQGNSPQQQQRQQSMIQQPKPPQSPQQTHELPRIQLQTNVPQQQMLIQPNMEPNNQNNNFNNNQNNNQNNNNNMNQQRPQSHNNNNNNGNNGNNMNQQRQNNFNNQRGRQQSNQNGNFNNNNDRNNGNNNGNNNWNNNNNSNGPRRYNAPPAQYNSNDPQSIQPVSTLNPYQNNWRIKVRVTAKDPVRRYNNAKGEGQVFSVDLLDKDGTEIRATMFNNAVDKFGPVLNKDHVYLISRGRVSVARKQYTHIKNTYAITLNEQSEVIPVDNDNDILKQTYHFVPIEQIANCEAGAYVDICAIVTSVSPISHISSTKTQRELEKRSIWLVDESQKSIELTLWEDLCREFDENKLAGCPVVAIKGARISDFGGKSLSCNGTIQVNPTDLTEATHLQTWYNNRGNLDNIEPLTAASAVGDRTPRYLISEVKERRLGLGETDDSIDTAARGKDGSDYFTVTGTITTVSHSQDKQPWYKAAPEQGCNFKVTPAGDGQWFCERNNKTYSSYVPRYILRFCVQDNSSQLWLTAFNDAAKSILNKIDCSTVEQYLNDGNMEQFEKVFNDACFRKFHFKVRARSDTYQDEQRVRYDCLAATPMIFATEAERLEEQIAMIRQSANQTGANNF